MGELPRSLAVGLSMLDDIRKEAAELIIRCGDYSSSDIGTQYDQYGTRASIANRAADLTRDWDAAHSQIVNSGLPQDEPAFREAMAYALYVRASLWIPRKPEMQPGLLSAQGLLKAATTSKYGFFRGWFEAAKSDYESSVGWHDTAHARYMLGMLLKENGRHQEAVPHFQAAERLDPEGEYGLDASKELARLSTKTGTGGRCFIATAACGSPLSWEVQQLQAFKRDFLMQSTWGRRLVNAYYRVSPGFAHLICKVPFLARAVRLVVIRPCARLAARCLLLSLEAKR